MLFGRKAPCGSLSMAEAAEILAKEKNIRLLDVRTGEEYQSGHLPGSELLPLDRIDQIGTVVPDKNARLFVYCHSGARSQTACRRLAAMGYTDVTNIGGIISWRGRIVRSHGA